MLQNQRGVAAPAPSGADAFVRCAFAHVLLSQPQASCLFLGSATWTTTPLDFGLDPQGERTVGWVARHFDTDKCGDGQCKLQKYMTSFYWAVMTMTTVCLPFPRERLLYGLIVSQ